jgi:transcriptional regulator with XRE-family HTH domain
MDGYQAEREELCRRFAATFKELREAEFSSQEAFADAANLHRTHVGFLEQGRREPSLSTLLILADTLGVPLQRLTDGLPIPQERRPRRRGKKTAARKAGG